MLPGEDLVCKGLSDLRAGVETAESLLAQIGGPRLRRLGFDIPPRERSPEMALWQLLAADNVDSAHSRYNALIRRLVSFERAAERDARLRSIS